MYLRSEMSEYRDVAILDWFEVHKSGWDLFADQYSLRIAWATYTTSKGHQNSILVQQNQDLPYLRSEMPEYLDVAIFGWV